MLIVCLLSARCHIQGRTWVLSCNFLPPCDVGAIITLTYNFHNYLGLTDKLLLKHKNLMSSKKEF